MAGHRLLAFLDTLAAHLATRPDAVALLAVGSVGQDTGRLDEHSDADFFVVVESPAAKAAYLSAPDWLDAVGTVEFLVRDTPDGLKALFADGVFVECAVFTVPELRAAAFTGARVVWQRADAGAERADLAALAAGGEDDPAVGRQVKPDAVRVGEALANLYVGLHRELRGEHLSATRFVQVHAVDHVLALAASAAAADPLPAAGPAAPRRDPFDPARRAERLAPDVPLAAMVAGYGANRAAALAVLDWLEARHPVNPAMATAIRTLAAVESPN